MSQEADEAPPAPEPRETRASVQPAKRQEPSARPVEPERKAKRTLADRRTSKPPKVRLAGGPDFFESEPAILLSVPAASYPAAARDTGTWAEVVVAVPVDETGAVGDPTIETSRTKGSAPESAFEEAAVAAARQARYTPARERGVPVRSQSTLTFTFGNASAGS